MKIKIIGLAVLAALAMAAPSFGAQAPIVAKALAVGHMQATEIHTNGGTVVLERITVAPGGSYGPGRRSALSR
jgi:hypothetical protein